MKTILKWFPVVPLAMLAAMFISAVPSPFVVKKFSDYPNGFPVLPTDLVLVQRIGATPNYVMMTSFQLISSIIPTNFIVPGSLTVTTTFTNTTDAYFHNIFLDGTFSISNLVVANPPYLNLVNSTNYQFTNVSIINVTTNITQVSYTSNAFFTNITTTTINSTTNISQYNFSTNLYVTGFFGSTNTWAGPSNVIDLSGSDWYFTSPTPCSITGVTNKTDPFSVGVSLTINNNSGSNYTVTFPSMATSDGTRSVVATNGQNTVLWIKYSPVGPQTNLVARPFL